MIVAEKDYRPLYIRLADSIAADIASGVLGPGQVLPSEPYLMQTHDLSRGTVRAAMAELRVRGLIVTQAGRGSFVKPD